MTHSDERGTAPVPYASALAIVVVAAAVAYRVAAFRDPLSFGVTSEGVDVKIGQAQERLASAATQLSALQAKLDAEETALRKSEQDLQAKDSQIRSLLADIQSLSRQPGATPQLRSLTPSIARLSGELAAQPAPQPLSSASEREKLRAELLSSRNDIETAQALIKSIGR